MIIIMHLGCARAVRHWLEWRGPMIIIMHATLHDYAPNTYYGQWLGGKAAVSGLKSPAIAHDELAASARFVAFDVPGRDFPGNRLPPVGNLYVDQKEKSAHLAKWRASSDGTPLTASI